MTKRIMPFAGIPLAIGGALCARFVPMQDMNWAVVGLTVLALAFALLDVHLAKKT